MRSKSRESSVDVDIDMAVEVDPLRPTPLSDHVVDEGMDVDSGYAVADEDPPLTQEELDVHDQLQALECSRDGPEPDEGDSVPAKCSMPTPSADLPRRKRTADIAFATDNVSTPSPLTAAGHMFDSDDDEATPPGLRSDPSPAGTTASGDDDDSDDDDVYAELRKHEQSIVVRRSSRVSKEVVRFDPHSDITFRTKGSSVFGGSLFGDTRSSKAATSALRAMMRERGAREREEKQVAEMREGIAEEKGLIGEKEAVFDVMAKEEDKREQRRLANLEKYSAPIPLFTSTVNVPEIKSKHLRKEPKDLSWHSLLHMLLEIFKAGGDGDIALSMLAPCVAQICHETESKDLFAIASIIFHLVVYDDSATKPGLVARDCLLDSLVLLCKNRRVDVGQGRLPTLVAVLEKYGAFFEDSAVPEVHTPRPACEDSLDALAKAEDNECPSEALAQATRNLRRACLFAAERIRLNDKFHRVISRKISKKDRPGSILYSLGVCVRTLLSVFGSRLHREVGLIITALLNRIEQKDWPEFRTRAAKYILSLTTRLGLHVELVTYLLPYSTERSRCLVLDVGYLSLVQWCAGPGGNPQPQDIQSFEPSEKAKIVGVADTSFCLADLVELAQSIPEFQKSTDVEWACEIARTLKQTLADRTILNRRDQGEIRALQQILTKLRSCAHRLEFGLPVQDMRLALDALLLAVRELLTDSKSALSEMCPNARIEKVQTRLPRATS